jgi:hypothetical protein
MTSVGLRLVGEVRIRDDSRYEGMSSLVLTYGGLYIEEVIL